MMLYLTGAPNSWKTSPDAPQNDPRMSLGGYVSSTPVPNGALNVLFDQISLLTLQNRPTECMAFALINGYDQPVSDVEIKIVGADDDVCQFEVAAVKVNDLQMESLKTRVLVTYQRYVLQRRLSPCRRTSNHNFACGRRRGVCTGTVQYSRQIA